MTGLKYLVIGACAMQWQEALGDPTSASVTSAGGHPAGHSAGADMRNVTRRKKAAAPSAGKDKKCGMEMTSTCATILVGGTVLMAYGQIAQASSQETIIEAPGVKHGATVSTMFLGGGQFVFGILGVLGRVLSLDDEARSQYAKEALMWVSMAISMIVGFLTLTYNLTAGLAVSELGGPFLYLALNFSLFITCIMSYAFGIVSYTRQQWMGAMVVAFVVVLQSVIDFTVNDPGPDVADTESIMGWIYLAITLIAMPLCPLLYQLFCKGVEAEIWTAATGFWFFAFNLGWCIMEGDLGETLHTLFTGYSLHLVQLGLCQYIFVTGHNFVTSYFGPVVANMGVCVANMGPWAQQHIVPWFLGVNPTMRGLVLNGGVMVGVMIHFGVLDTITQKIMAR